MTGMWKLRGWMAVVATGMLAVGTAAQGPKSADDILPPVLGGPQEVAQPREVKDQDGCVHAASAQDAANAAAKKLEKQAAERKAAGCTMVRFPSGLGYVASGLATYGEFDNPTATGIARRHAYVAAYTVA